MSQGTRLQFLSWSRRGIGAAPTTAVTGGRRSVRIALTVTARSDGRDERRVTDAGPSEVAVLGPGDICPTGEDLGIIACTPPPDGAALEPNLLASVEFAHPDLPWIYSLDSDDRDEAQRRMPWLMLVVVALDDPAVTIEPTSRTPYDVLVVADPTVLPDPAHAWAFAHIQVVDDDPDRARATVIGSPNSAHIRSRLVAATRLSPSRRYVAAVVPTYESARAYGADGLVVATDALWTRATTTRLPIYHSWHFDTAPAGDFERLARQLNPLPPEQFGDLGVRRVLIDRAAALLPVDDAGEFVTEAHTVATAITRTPRPGPLAPRLLDAPDHPPPHPSAATIHTKLKRLLDLVATNTDPNSEHPVVGPPLYGQWPARAHSIDQTPGTPGLVAVPESARLAWLQQLNADPHLRIAAGLGVQLVQRDQEEYLAQAWDQLSDVITANLRIRWSTTMAAALSTAHADLGAAPQTTVLRTLASTLGRVVGDDGRTLRAGLEQSSLPREALGAALVRTARYLVRPTRFQQNPATVSAIVTRTALAMARSAPEAVPSRFSRTRVIEASAVAELLADTKLADRVRRLSGIDPTEQLARIDAVPTTFATLAAKVTDEPLAADTASVTVQVRLDDRFRQSAVRLADMIERPIGSVSSLPGLSAARTEITDLVRPSSRPVLSPDALAALTRAAVHRPPTQGWAGARVDETVERISFGARLSDAPGSFIAATGGNARARLVGAAEALTRLTMTDLGLRLPEVDDLVGDLDVADIAAIGDIVGTLPAPTDGRSTVAAVKPFSFDTARQLLTRVEPHEAYGRMLSYAHGFGDGVRRRTDSPFDPVMAAPRIHTALVNRLRALDEEWVLGGVGRLPADSICLLGLDRRFVEALLVGANHEFAREMLWRGYPTDLRGTCFHRFWDAPPEASIDDISTWSGPLGGHSRLGDDLTVLVIKGELLRRYPRTLISAEKGTTTTDRGITTFTADTTVVVKELFRGFLGEDVSYSVFDTGGADLRRTDPADDRHGWYISLLEPYDELRFGLDETAAPDSADLTWEGLPGVRTLTPDHVRARDSSATAAVNLLQKPFRLLLRARDYLPQE